MPTKPTLDIFSGSESLGTIIFEQQQLNTKFTDFTVPLTGDSGNVAVNWKGRVRSIVLQGFSAGDGFSGATADLKLKDFIDTIEEWVGAANDGFIQRSVVYTNSFGQSYNVKCYDWTWARSVTDPFRINYSLLLKVV